MERERKREVVVAHRESTVRHILEVALTARDWVVHTTARGEDAIRLVLDREPAALLLSLDLENVDGWRVVEVLRGAATEAMIVALTADARRSTRERALEWGFDRYMPLPVEPFEVADRLEELGKGGSPEETGWPRLRDRDSRGARGRRPA